MIYCVGFKFNSLLERVNGCATLRAYAHMFRTVLKVAVSVIGLKEMCNVPDMFNTFFLICIIQRDTFICSPALVIHT